MIYSNPEFTLAAAEHEAKTETVVQHGGVKQLSWPQLLVELYVFVLPLMLISPLDSCSVYAMKPTSSCVCLSVL